MEQPHIERVPYCLYILDGHTPVPTKDVFTWGKWFEQSNRHVAYTTLESGVCISTVFVGLNQAWWSHAPPLFFETMVFDPSKPRLEQWLEEYTRRYTTWEEAEAGHREVVDAFERDGDREVTSDEAQTQ
jgi:hypothetical protein